MIPQELKEMLKKHRYQPAGRHSAVKLCYWNMASIKSKGERHCYKQEWYGTDSHRCVQCTPSSVFCDHMCRFCWRTQPSDIGVDWNQMSELGDEPKDIVNAFINAQRILIRDLARSPKCDPKLIKKAMEPRHFALSLSGEPMFYSRIGEILQELRKRNHSTFIVTNGTFPETLKKMPALPSQLYVTLPAPDEEMYEYICRPLIKGGWDRLMETLSMLSSLDCRTCIRITAVKGMNIENIETYRKIIEKANPNFVEVKGFSMVGSSAMRLNEDHQPSHAEILEFSRKLGYPVIREFEPSKVSLLDVNWGKKSTKLKGL